MAFVLRFGLYKFTILPIGLYNAPSTFQRLINHILSDIIDWYVLAYLYDILVYSKTTNNHEKHLHEVFSLLYAHNSQKKYAECEFRCAKVHCFGYIVGSGKLQVDIEKVDAAMDWPIPSCIRDT